jgi:hypothetical protein
MTSRFTFHFHNRKLHYNNFTSFLKHVTDISSAIPRALFQRLLEVFLLYFFSERRRIFPYSLLEFNVCLRLAVSNLFKVFPEKVKTRGQTRWICRTTCCGNISRTTVIDVLPVWTSPRFVEPRCTGDDFHDDATLVPRSCTTVVSHHKIVAIHGSYSQVVLAD